MAKSNSPVRCLCIYRMKPGQNAAFEELLAKHWPALVGAGLATNEQPTVHKAADRSTGATIYIEVFHWKDKDAPGTAHETPSVMAVWEPMGACCSDMEFLHLEAVPMPNAT